MHHLSSTFRFAATMFLTLLAMATGSAVSAQNINNGRQLYITPQVAGNPSKCSDGACHGPSPANNQNKIQNAANVPEVIGLATNNVQQMLFLKGKLNGTQLADLAAYIGNPSAATGPALTVNPEELSFSATNIGAVSAPLPLTVTSNGTVALIVSSVTSNSSEFVAQSNCGTVAVNATCTINVTFNPAATGFRTGTITINHNASGGSSTVIVSGQGAAVVVNVSPGNLAFGSVVVGGSSIMQAATLQNGPGPVLISSIGIDQPSFVLAGGTCAAGGTLLANASCTVLVRFVPDALGTRSGMLNITHNGAGGGNAIALTGIGLGAPPTTRVMTEYIYTPLNYYFITSRDSDKLVLDGISTFRRTGADFTVFISEEPGSKGISRYYFDKIAKAGARGTHFYTLLETEKALLKSLNPSNSQAPRLPFDEGIDSYAFLPEVEGVGGRCASGLIPVYRIFRGNARFPDDPNHRFTTNIATYNELVAAGWDDEGVKFCVPPQ